LILFAVAFLTAAPATAADLTGVPTVVDGGTLEINYQRVRLEGIQTPRDKDVCQLDGKTWMCGWEATNALANIVGRHWVSCKSGICKAGDVLDLNAQMVRRGWAWVTPTGRQAYGHLERLARREGRGLWKKSRQQVQAPVRKLEVVDDDRLR